MDNKVKFQADLKRIRGKNEQYPHSTLKYLSPNEFERRWTEKQATSVPQFQFFEVDEGFNTWARMESKSTGLDKWGEYTRHYLRFRNYE